MNQTYLDVVAIKKGLKESLEHMVETESYRWICMATYSLSPKPLRSQRTLEKEQEPTTVNDSVVWLNWGLKKANVHYSLFLYILIIVGFIRAPNTKT